MAKFIEEFYLISEDLAEQNINVILYEGEGQGGTLQQEKIINKFSQKKMRQDALAN